MKSLFKKVKLCMLWILLYCILLLFFYPYCVSILRTVQFDTVPRDRYDGMLLSFIDKKEFNTAAPWGYRLLNVAIAIPFYAIPLFKFSQIDIANEKEYNLLRAQQAIAILNYCSIIAIALLLAMASHHYYKNSLFETSLVAFFSFIYTSFSAWYSNDIPVIFYIALVYITLQNKKKSIPLILLSAFFNEKIFIVFLLLCTVRLYSSPNKKLYVQLLLSCLTAAGLYYLMTVLYPLPLPLHQKEIGMHFLSTVVNNVKTAFSIRGLFLVVLPISILAFLAIMNLLELMHKTKNSTTETYFNHYISQLPEFYKADIIVIPLYLIIITMVSIQWNVGRIIIMLYPFYIFGACSFISRLIFRLANTKE